MAVEFDKLKKIIEDAFPDAVFRLEDMLGDADHYGLTITSSVFEGLNRVKRHQIVYKALGSLMGNELHALSIRAYTPQENQKKES
ncbi:MAG: BolA family transcriptional regulator [Alphaproteobacteria bacterium]|nr:BolA family transcriptional regulator [Alphaproteobacteria bacterium]NCQ67683.1 BolA family transcriptional regulator [Alphaproteobacteria bacterium]NCT07555.1 BolA family transcriptional regulator [Alphaproteobacteria bacterium]